MTDPAVQHYMRGLQLYGQDKHPEAIAEYARALELKPEWADCLQAVGMAELADGKVDQAIATLERVVELAPDDPLAYTSLSMAYVRKERIEDAEKAQETARMLAWKKEHGGGHGA